MNIRISTIPDVEPTIRQCRIIRIVLMVAVGLTVANARCVEAQAPAQSSSSQTAASSMPATSTPPQITSEYRINPEDVLDLYVFDVPELSREYTVSSAGNVTVPLLPKPVQAAGLSPDQFARALEQNFREAGSLSRPQITVTVKQSRRSMVAVNGAVRAPQTVAVSGRTQLLSVLSQCGGLADDHGGIVTVSRGAVALHELDAEGKPGDPTVTVELKRLMDASDPTSQFSVWPGDRVSVEHAGIFYVLGEVGHPGGYNLKSAQEQVTILEALAIAGDVTFVAKKSKAVIIRKDSKDPSGRREIALNITNILSGRAPDQILQSNDVLYVPASGGRRAVRTLSNVPGAVAAAAAYSRF